jgi:tight adherence protein C
MIYLITIGAFLAAMLFILAAYSLVAPQSQQVVADRLTRLRTLGRGRSAVADEDDMTARADKPLDQMLVRIVQPLGRLFGQATAATSGSLRRRLMMAGFYAESAVLSYLGVRVLLAVALPLVTILVLSQFEVSVLKFSFFLPLLALAGFIGPSFVLSSLISRRQLSIRNGLADALDLMVSCVEAGLSLNAALARVSVELRSVHLELSQEFDVTGFEMRTGKPREEALRNLGQRSGVRDLKSFTAMLIQTDKFGTSISKALRVFSDTLRTKRRQRAEEAAAKTTIKLVFPLVFFIFPAIMIVLLGPGLIQIIETFKPAVER